jgi:type II secretory pathway pseudopilin PulG
MKPQQRIGSSDGFTLMEAMIATAILGLSLAAVLAVLSQSARYITDIRRAARSSQVLQQEMENIRLTNGWSGLLGLNNTTFLDPGDSNHLYAGRITQAAYAPSVYNGATNVVIVTLTVTWTNQVNRVSTNTLSTLVGNGGLNKYIF